MIYILMVIIGILLGFILGRIVPKNYILGIILILVALIVCFTAITAYAKAGAIVTPEGVSIPHEETMVEKKQLYSEDTIDLMSKIVYLEAGTCTEVTQKYVASVILNQVAAGYWGDSIEEVVSYGNNYTSYNYIDEVKSVPDNVKNVVKDVLEHGSYLPGYVRYFRAWYDHQFEGYENYCIVDDVYFGYFVDWQKGVH